MAGLFNGTLNESKSGIWDYKISQGEVEQKFLNDTSESPSIGGFTNALNSLGEEAIAKIKNTLLNNRPEITGTNLFLVNDDEITEYKKEILRKILVDITCITIDNKINRDLFKNEVFLEIDLNYPEKIKSKIFPLNKNILNFVHCAGYGGPFVDIVNLREVDFINIFNQIVKFLFYYE
jgi:hypothetical protein